MVVLIGWLVDGGLFTEASRDAAIGEYQEPGDGNEGGGNEEKLVPSALVGQEHRVHVPRLERYRGETVYLRKEPGMSNTPEPTVSDLKTSPVGDKAFVASNTEPPALTEEDGLDPESFEARVAKVIEIIRPAIQADEGDIFLRGVHPDTGIVDVELVGACVSCPASTATLKDGLERILKQRVDGVTGVVHVGEALFGAEEGTRVTL